MLFIFYPKWFYDWSVLFKSQNLTFKLIGKQVKIDKHDFMFATIALSGKDAVADANFGNKFKYKSK